MKINIDIIVTNECENINNCGIQLHRKIATGGEGEIFLAFDTRRSTDVVAKFCKKNPSTLLQSLNFHEEVMH